MRGSGPSARMSLASRAASRLDPGGRVRAHVHLHPASAAAALLLGAATFVLAALNQHAPYDITPGPIARLLAWWSPGIAAVIAGLAVVAPWPGLLLVAFLSAYWDAAQVGWWVGPIQVTLSTAFATALLAGWALTRRREAHRGPVTFGRSYLVALAVLAIATLSTLGSSDTGQSAPVWLHGVVEPIVFALLVLLLRPGVAGIAGLAIAMGLSVALGSLINLAQTLPTVSSFQEYQLRGREFLSRLTYFNVGLFGEMLAMAIPLLAGALLARRALRLRSWQTVAVGIGLSVALLSLYLTFQKSGWLATVGGLLVLGLAMLARPRLRLAVLAAVLAASALIVPWPALLIRPVAPGLADSYDRFIVAVQGSDRASSWDPSTPQGEVSITERFRATSTALRMALDHPLLGVGLDRFAANYAGPYHDPTATRSLDSAHDLLPNLAAELGLLAAALVALAMAAGVVACWRTWRRPRDDLARLTAAGLGSSLVAWWIVSATFDPDLYRTWRLMSSDVIFAAMLVAMAIALEAAGRAEPAMPAMPATPEATVVRSSL